MCGISGVIGFNSTLDKEGIAEKILDAQKHRGPDGAGVSSGDNYSLGQSRLKVTGLVDHPLPMSSSDKRYTLCFNGQITNWQELKKELTEFSFRYDTDTEVVLYGYMKWGKNCVNRFSGMFSFFIWDSVDKIGFGARDPIGIKPFVYVIHKNNFIFGSEVKGVIQALNIRPKLNETALHEYLISPYFSGVSSLIFENVELLPAGHSVVFSEHDFSVNKYYEFLPGSKLGSGCGLEEILSAAVMGNMQGNKIPGLFLSGGVDSSILCALMTKHTESKINNFSISFHNHEDIDFGNSITNSLDEPFAKIVSESLGNTMETVKLNKESSIEALEDAFKSNDRIVSWEQEVSQQSLSRYSSGTCKSVLVGDAADETHFGYFFLLSPEVTKSPENLYKRFGIPPLRNKDWIHELNKSHMLLAEDAGLSWSDLGSQRLAMSYLVSKLWLGRLMHNGDIHTMAHSLEARVPFGERNLLDYCQSLKPEWSMENDTGKAELRKMADKYLPVEISRRRKSALPFNFKLREMYGDWLRKAVNPFSDFLDKYVFLDKILGPESPDMIKFRILCLCKWLEKYGNLL